MFTRTLKQFLTVNALEIETYFIVEIRDTIVVLHAHRGRPDVFRVELTYSEVEYLACAVSFEKAYLRLALPGETFLHQAYPQFTIFCFEQRGRSPVQESEKFFIVAKGVEVVVVYEDETYGQVLDAVDV